MLKVINGFWKKKFLFWVGLAHVWEKLPYFGVKRGIEIVIKLKKKSLHLVEMNLDFLKDVLNVVF